MCCMVYCGKAHAMNAACNAGLRRRMDSHRKEIQRIRQCHRNGALYARQMVIWTYERRTHKDVEKIDYGVLSVLPFLHGDNSYFVHFHCLLALAQAIEVLYVGTQVGRDCARFSMRYGGELG